MKVEFINDTDWRDGKTHKAGSVANVDDRDGRELVHLGAAKQVTGQGRAKKRAASKRAAKKRAASSNAPAGSQPAEQAGDAGTTSTEPVADPSAEPEGQN